MPKACIYAGFRHLFYQRALGWALFVWRIMFIVEQMQTYIAENSQMALNQSEYEELTERYNIIKAIYDELTRKD